VGQVLLQNDALLKETLDMWCVLEADLFRIIASDNPAIGLVRWKFNRLFPDPMPIG